MVVGGAYGGHFAGAAPSLGVQRAGALGLAQTGGGVEGSRPCARGSTAHSAGQLLACTGTAWVFHRLNICLYFCIFFTTVYIFIDYFYQGFSRLHTPILYNVFSLVNSSVCTCAHVWVRERGTEQPGLRPRGRHDPSLLCGGFSR